MKKINKNLMFIGLLILLFSGYLIINNRFSSAQAESYCASYPEALFCDDFTADTAGSYAWSELEASLGSYSWDSINQRLEVLTENDTGWMLTQAINPTNNGAFSFMFTPFADYPNRGIIRVRLMENAQNYYQLIINSADEAPLLEKVVSGVSIDSANGANFYSSDSTDYSVEINFSPASTEVNALGEQLIINTEATPVSVNYFEIDIFQQDAYLDNILFNPGEVSSPAACSYIYSPWSACQPNGTRTRTVTSSSPSGCTGTPALTQSCTYTPPATSGNALYVNNNSGSNCSDSYTKSQARNSNTPWCSIGRAAWGSANRSAPNASEAAQAGDTVYVTGGTYITTGTNSRYQPAYNPVNSGATGNPITFEALGTVNLAYSSGIGPVIGSYAKNYIKWKGFTINEANALSTSDTGPVVLWDTTGVIIENCVINGNGDPGYGDNHNGIRVQSSNYGEVRNNAITNVYTSGVNGANGAGVMFYESDNNIIENNEISNSGSGIFIKGPADIRSNDNILRFNYIYNISNSGIILSGAEDTTVYQNVVKDSAEGIRLWELTSTAKPVSNYIINNTAQNLSLAAFNLRIGDISVINHIRNNVVTDAPFMYYSESAGATGNLVANYNIFDDYSSSFAQLNIGNISLPSWVSSYGVDSLSISSDPLYVNEAADNFILQPSSPARTIGIDILDLDSDGLTTDTIPAGAYITGNENIGITNESASSPAACSYIYSPWSACQPNGTRTRTVTSSSPSGCTGTPALTQSCTYTPPATSGNALYVNNNSGSNCSDSYTKSQARNSNTPWCSIGRAAWGSTARPASWPGINQAEAADAGDIVYISAGTYHYAVDYDAPSRWDPLYRLVNADDANDYITFTTINGNVILTSNTNGMHSIAGGSSTDGYIKWDGGDYLFVVNQANMGFRQGNGVINSMAHHAWIEKWDITGIYTEYGFDDQHNGILVQGGDGTAICTNNVLSNVTIRNNRIHGFRGGSSRNDSAITIYCLGDNILIEHNEIYENHTGIYAKSSYRDSVNFTVRYNNFYSNSGDAIAMQAWSDWRVYQNIMRDNSGAGFHFMSTIYFNGDPKPSDTYVVNNTMDNNGYAFYIEGVCDNLNGNFARNNILTNYSNIIFNEDSACQSTANIGADDIDFDYNRYEYSGNFWVNDGGGTVSTFDSFRNNYGQDTYSTNNADCQYTNEAGNDFTLQTGSSCREGQVNDCVDILDLDNDGSVVDAITCGAYITGNENIGITNESASSPAACSYIYSPWSACQPNGTRTRTVTSSSPSGCTGTPALTQSCSYIDTTAPAISNVSAVNITTSSATINWTTNELSDTQVEYGLTSSYGQSSSLNSGMITSHSATISSLSSNTIYNYRIRTRDAAGNLALGINRTFTTQAAATPDTTAPAAITDLSAGNITQTSVGLSWTAPGDDANVGVAASYDIRYSTANITDTNWSSATQVTGEPFPAVSGSDQYVSVGLSPNTTYYFAIKSTDEAGNISNISNIVSLTTLDEGTNPPSTPPTSPPAQSPGSGPSGPSGTISDTTSPAQPSDFTAQGADSQITLNWNNPTDSDFVRVIILRTQSDAEEPTCPTSHNDSNAEIVYEGSNEEYTDINLDNNLTYCYAIFAYDQKPNYSIVSAQIASPKEGVESIKQEENKKQEISQCPQYTNVSSLFNIPGTEANTISVCEASAVQARSQKVDLDQTGIDIYNKLKGQTNLAELNILHKYSIAYFIYFGTPTTKILGAGERAGVINSYYQAFNKLPTTLSEWSDVIKIANGRWPSEQSAGAESTAKNKFKEIYLRDADMDNPNDNAAVTVISYGLRPANRNLDSEKAGIKIFKAIFKSSPVAALAWDIVRAIAYSGAER